MEIAFITKELRELCLNEETATRALGSNAAEALKKRLADINAAEWITEVLAGRPKRYKSSESEGYIFELDSGLILKVIPNHLKQRIDVNHQVDWTKVRRVKVVFVGERDA